MKRILILLISLTMIVLAISLPSYAAGVRVDDRAGVMSAAEKSTVENTAKTISEKYNIDVVVVTTNEIDLTDLSDYEFEYRLMNYADDYYDYNSFGKDGFLLLVAFDGNDIGFWISTSGKCYDYFTEDDFSDIQYAYSKDFRSRGYTHGQAIDNALGRCSGVIKSYRSVSPFLFVIAAVIGLIVSAIVTGSMKRKLKSVRSKPAASDYVKKGSINITHSSETFLYTNVSRVRIESNSRSGGSHGGHYSSSGSFHGGGGGRV